MDIEVSGDNAKFRCKVHTIREKPERFDELEPSRPRDHFEALIEDRRKKNTKPVACKVIYYDANGVFLGFDEDIIHGMSNSKEIPVSMPITVPESATKAQVVLEERHYSEPEALGEIFLGIIIVVAAAAIVAYAVKGFFGWS